jgi:poly(3-hydroxybutyrate) depolymerase
MVKKFMVWLLCVAMLPAAAFAALPVVKPLATTVPVYEPMGGIKMGISGLFERAITVGGTNRTVKLYVPDGAVLGAYMVVMTVPSGVATVPWLVDSGWIGLADREKFLLYVFEPGASGTWDTVDAEQSYIETAYNNISVNTTDGRGTWYLPPESYYVVGYGPAGAALHKLVMKDPTLVAAAAFVDASDIGPEYLAQMSSNFFPTPDWNGNAVASSSVPLPVWIISGDTSGNTGGVIEYWKKANQTIDHPGVAFQGGQIFLQKEDTLDGYVAGSVSAAAVLEQQNASTDPTMSQKIYEDFISLYTRYGGNVGGNTVGTRAHYATLGVEYKAFALGGRLREYLVYAPQKAKAAAQRGENVPLVFALHGANLSMYSMFDFSRWWEAADKGGFIAVFPTGLNKNNRTGWSTSAAGVDMTFIQMVLDAMKANYNVDASRIYIGGQSAGCGMSQAVGRNLALSPNFTAVGCTSFPSSSTNFAGEVLPFYMTYGEFDSTVGSWLLTTPRLADDLTYWITRNHALGTPTTPASQETIGRHVIYKWNNVDGLNVVRYSLTKGRGHSITPDDTKKLWSWYDLWQKDATGNNVMVGLASCKSPSDPALASGGCLPALTVQFQPTVVNLRETNGVVTAVLAAAPGYNLSSWSLSDPMVGNISPVGAEAAADGKSYVLTFNKSALTSLPTGTDVPVSITANLAANGRHGPVAATATVRIIR